MESFRELLHLHKKTMSGDRGYSATIIQLLPARERAWAWPSRTTQML